MKKSFIKKNFKKLLVKKLEEKEFNKEEIYNVGVLSSYDISQYVNISSQVENILGLGNVRIYNYRPYSSKDVPSYKFFTEKDFTWKGKPKNKQLKSFLEEPFDLLIGYFHKPNLYLENAVLWSEASLKVGFAKVNQDIFDIEIAENPSNVIRFLEEVKKYLIVMNKLKN